MTTAVPPRAGGRTTGNPGRLLDIIRSAGPVSRVEIADRSGLTQASVSTIVRGLLDDGLVREVGHAVSTGGKRRTMLEISPDARCAIGVHLGADSIVFVVTDMAGGIVGRQRTDGAGDHEPARVVPRIASSIQELLGTLGLPHDRVIGVGVVAAGPLDYSAGSIAGVPAMAHWESYPVRKELESALGMPVVVDKDATAAALGEFWGGRVDAPLSFVGLYMGTGIGAGIVSNGVAFRGSASNAGEIGHVSIDPDGPLCRCGNRGCLELSASPLAVVAAADGAPTTDRLSTAEVARRFDELARAAVQGDAAALALIHGSARRIGEAALTLANLIDPDLIVLAGPGFAIAGAIYIEQIRSVLGERFFARRVHGIEVRMATNPRDAAALGAAALVLQQSLAPRA